MPYFSHDDIAQIGTPPGQGALGALRISGDNAFAILLRTTTGLEEVLAGRPARGVFPCRLVVELAERGRRDAGRTAHRLPARALVMPAPASYTREDVAEIHLPGSPALLQAALAALVRAGARPAAPGEFTFRAFRNGRLTLGQAEAVEEVVRAGNAADLRRALGRLGGHGRDRALAWRSRAMDLAARVEAALDFPEEDLDEDFAASLAAMAGALEREGRGVDAGSALPVLPQAALVGLANAGKSSLFNALLGDGEALVSPAASTTRDSLRREACWDGVRLLLSDNPGYHPSGSGAAGEAAARAAERLGSEDLACWVIDGSRALDDTDRALAGRLSGRVIIAVNKCDLPAGDAPGMAEELAQSVGLDVLACLPVSAATGDGVAALRRCLAEAGRSLSAAGEWNRRELLELASALEHCRAAAGELATAGRLELAGEDLRRAVTAFSRLAGEGYAEDALNRIFSQFCIGK